MLIDTNSVLFKSRLLNELFKNDIDYDTAVVLLDCIEIATDKVANEVSAEQ